MEAWRQQGVLIREREPALWALRQDFTGPDGERRSRTGFFARVRVEDYGAGRIRPHERTHPGPKEDRLRLTRATRANLSPIFSLFPDPDGAAREQLERATEDPPFATTAEGTLWRIGDAEAIAALQSALAEAELLIADGHHRYETARVYAEEIGGEGEHEYVLMFLCSLSDPGPDRLPDSPAAHGAEGRQREAAGHPRRPAGRLRGRGGGERGARGRRHLRLHGLLPQAGLPLHAQGPVGRRRRAERQAGALPPPGHRRARGAGAEGRAEDERRRHRPQARARLLEELRRRGRGGDLGSGRRRLLHAGHADRRRCRRWRRRGESMPPKSTYFFPKVPTGLVFNLLE